MKSDLIDSIPHKSDVVDNELQVFWEFETSDDEQDRIIKIFEFLIKQLNH
jgi:hypothetical protein